MLMAPSKNIKWNKQTQVRVLVASATVEVIIGVGSGCVFPRVHWSSSAAVTWDRMSAEAA